MKELSLSEYVVPVAIPSGSCGSESRYKRLPGFVRSLAANSRDAVLLETARFDEENRHSYLFRDPVKTLAARELRDIPEVFARIESELAAGRYVAGYVGYECGRYFALENEAGPQ